MQTHVNRCKDLEVSIGNGGLQTLTAPNFSQITNDISGNGGLLPGDYRVVQLAMKFIF
jgi:hypothetical protein